MIIDAMIDFMPGTATRLASDPRMKAAGELFGASAEPYTIEDVIRLMDEGGVDRALATGGLLADGLFDDGLPVAPGVECTGDVVLETCAKYPERFRAGLTVDRVGRIRAVCARIEELAGDPMLAAIRIVPLFQQEPINSRVFYPVYERCEALGLPVTINVGIPGPRVRAACQDPMLLDDVLIDFPDLVVVADHMGHPWESLLVALMMKYSNLYLSTTAYLAKYIDPEVVRFMNSSRGRDKVMFGTDFPLLQFGRAVTDARALPISPEALDAYLGGNAARVFRWKA